MLDDDEMLIEREELCSLVPHAGWMCLLEGVFAWNAEEVQCMSRSHLRPENPLRSEAGLGVVHSLEYGAQAVALHGGLLARASGRPAKPRWLVAIRDARFGGPQWLEAVNGALSISARRIGGGDDGVLYRFEVRGDDLLIVNARATVMVPRGVA